MKEFLEMMTLVGVIVFGIAFMVELYIALWYLVIYIKVVAL